MKTVIISLGGSIIAPNKIDVEFVKAFKELILKSGYRAIIICGGGKVCRDYINAAKCISKLEENAGDWIGIVATRLNGELIKAIFGKHAHDKVVYEYDKEIKTNKKIIIGAGWLPGCSSDLDAVLAAEMFKGDTIINLSNIDFVYNKDPRKFDDAKQLKRVSWKDFRKIVGNEWKAGMNFPFDPVAAKEAEKLKLKVVVMKGTEINNLKSFFEGKKFNGTTIE
jgi:uridylate kinase